MQALSASSPRQSVQDYIIALLVFAAAVAVRVLPDPIVPDGLPFITFFPADKISLPGAKVAHELKADGLACEIRLPNSA
jgi:hypothetical protein